VLRAGAPVRKPAEAGYESLLPANPTLKSWTREKAHEEIQE
jgi:hypothetical protein